MMVLKENTVPKLKVCVKRRLATFMKVQRVAKTLKLPAVRIINLKETQFRNWKFVSSVALLMRNVQRVTQTINIPAERVMNLESRTLQLRSSPKNHRPVSHQKVQRIQAKWQSDGKRTNRKRKYNERSTIIKRRIEFKTQGWLERLDAWAKTYFQRQKLTKPNGWINTKWCSFP